jgi:3-hydroxybutyryl-CoA dehydratase
VYESWFDDVDVGQNAEYGGVTVTESHVVGFAGLTGDHHRLHTDAEFAARSMYRQRVVHGFLVLSLSAGLFPMDPEKVMAFYGMEGVRFLQPTFIGDTLRCRLTVVGKLPKPGGGVVDTAMEMVNQRDQVVAVARLRILVAGRPGEAEA